MQTLLYNKNKHVSGQKLDDMLLQLRQLINQQSIEKSRKKVSNSKTQQKSVYKPKDIDSIIQQSTKLIQKSQKKKTIKASIRGKILAASQILKDQNQLIKSYIRDKIESQLFSSGIENQQKQNSYLQEQKKKIIRLKEQQLQKQNTNKKRIIQNVKQFNQNNSRVKVSVHEIDSLIYKQDPNSTYLLELDNGKKIASNSNQIKNSNLFFKINEDDNKDELINNPNGMTKNNSNIRSKYSNNMKSKSQHIQPQFDQQYKEFLEEPQGFEKFSNLQTTNPAATGLNNVLNKYPHLVTIFYTFLINQIKIKSLDSAFNLMPKIITNHIALIKQQKNQNQGQSFFWKCTKTKKPNNKLSKQSKKDAPLINNIAQKYRFKGFGINQQSKVQFQRRKICQRRINKMIGQSKNFHPKKCLLTKNELIYYQQKDKVQQSNSAMFQMCLPQATKKIQIEVQRIKIENNSKQEGSFFSKKQINIQIVQLKGKNRSIKFQNKFLQGQQLVYDLRKLMANKVYRQYCIIKGMNNINLYQFINNPNSKILEVSTQLINASSQKQQKKIPIITDLSSNRAKIQAVNLINTKILSSQLNQIFLQSKQFQKLKKIQIIHVKLNNQTFLSLCQFVNDIYNKCQLDVVLKDTRLEDQCFMSNVGPFTSFCSKVKYLDISYNNITAKTIQIIKNCIQSVTTIIQRLNVSYCPIIDILKITSLIKEARKLQILEAQCCDFDLDLIKQNQLQKIFQFLKKCCPTFKRLNISKNGALKSKQYEIIQRMWTFETIESLQIDIDIGNYQKVQKASQNVNNQNQRKSLTSTFLNMEIIRNTQSSHNK